MFKKIGLIVVLGLISLGVYIHAQSEDLTIAVSQWVQAPVEEVFPYINDFRLFNQWSPWAKMDPNCKIEFSGSESGEGAVFTWSGNANVGEGKETIVKSVPNSVVDIQLEFIKPFPAINSVQFSVEPQNNGTLVTWSMQGKKNFLMKAMGLFMDCHGMMQEQFHQGLHNLKALLEKN